MKTLRIWKEMMRELWLTLILSVALGLPSVTWAGLYDNSLWLGNDQVPGLAVLNTDRQGNVLTQVNDTPVVGIAINPAADLIYFYGPPSNGTITYRDLDTPDAPVGSFSPVTYWGEDMAFDGIYLWHVEKNTGASIHKIDPGTGSDVTNFPVNFMPVGIAWDGTYLWVSELREGTGTNLVQQFTTNGEPTGNVFTNTLGDNGGLAFDTTDNTLWIGTWHKVWHFETNGTYIGEFDVIEPDGSSNPSHFIDGLEFQGAFQVTAVPEPTSLLLLATGLVGLASGWRRREQGRRRRHLPRA